MKEREAALEDARKKSEKELGGVIDELKSDLRERSTQL